MTAAHPRGALRAALSGLFVLMLAASALLPVRSQTPDPSTPGPYSVTKEEYNFGDTAFTVTGYTPAFGGPVELNGSVFYPSTAAGSGNPLPGPFPLIVFLHGRHSSAYNPTTGRAASQWPPVAPNISIPSYEGYDYISQTLASDGYVVVSIGANGINAKDAGTFDAGALARAEVIQKQLDIWNALAKTGDTTTVTPGANPFGGKFVGKVDMNNIGTMGHSRGGEGVMAHAVYNADATKNPEAANGPAYPIKAVLPLAPIDFNRYVVNGIPFAVILPYCDGDVSDLQGIHFYDDARYNVPGDTTSKYFWTIMGADHNFSNTVWTPGLFPYQGAPYGFGGTADDWLGTPNGAADPYAGATVPGNHRLSPAQQQAVVRNYVIAFFRTYVGDAATPTTAQYLPFLKGDAPVPASSPTNELYETALAPDMPGTRLDINRFLDANSLSTDALGGTVVASGLTPLGIVGGNDTVPAQRPLPSQPAARQPNNTPSNFALTMPGLTQLSFGWSSPQAYLENDIPAAYGNVSGYGVLQFRAAVNFTDSRNRVAQDDFSVVLTDSHGVSVSVPVSRYSAALLFPPGKLVRIPKVVLNAVRIPLSAFAGVDLTQVTSVRFAFDRQPQGALLLTDLAFLESAAPVVSLNPRPVPAARRRLTLTKAHAGAGRATARL